MSGANWMPLAKLELEEILFYIAVEGGRPALADSIGRQIRDKADQLAQGPLLGEARPDLGPNLRLFSFKRWALVYRPTETSIEVIGLVDAA